MYNDNHVYRRMHVSYTSGLVLFRLVCIAGLGYTSHNMVSRAMSSQTCAYHASKDRRTTSSYNYGLILFGSSFERPEGREIQISLLSQHLDTPPAYLHMGRPEVKP